MKDLSFNHKSHYKNEWRNAAFSSPFYHALQFLELYFVLLFYYDDNDDDDDDDVLLRWRRITLPVPTAALSPSTRFRWRQLDHGRSSWAVDNSK